MFVFSTRLTFHHIYLLCLLFPHGSRLQVNAQESVQSNVVCGGVECFIVSHVTEENEEEEEQLLLNCTSEEISNPRKTLLCLSNPEKILLTSTAQERIIVDRFAPGALARLFAPHQGVFQFTMSFITIKTLKAIDFENIPILNSMSLWNPLEMDANSLYHIQNPRNFRLKLQCESENMYFQQGASMLWRSKSWILILSHCKTKVTCSAQESEDGNSVIRMEFHHSEQATSSMEQIFHNTCPLPLTTISTTSSPITTTTSSSTSSSTPSYSSTQTSHSLTSITSSKPYLYKNHTISTTPEKVEKTTRKNHLTTRVVPFSINHQKSKAQESNLISHTSPAISIQEAEAGPSVSRQWFSEHKEMWILILVIMSTLNCCLLLGVFCVLLCAYNKLGRRSHTMFVQSEELDHLNLKPLPV